MGLEQTYLSDIPSDLAAGAAPDSPPRPDRVALAGPCPVTVYTDGGCDPNPGPGGWAAILCFPDREVVLTGNALRTTNNRMELEAALSALAYLQARHGAAEVELYTDSTYLRHGITRWIDRWFARGWLTTGRRAVQNQDLWRPLYELTRAHRVRWHWTQGHAGDPLNERVDALAGQARESLPST